MRRKRNFSREFKSQVVEEYLSGISTVGQLSRRCEISPNLIYRWKKDYEEGRLTDSSSDGDLGLRMRVLELERLVGELVLENKLLKKVKSFAEQKKKENSSIVTGPSYTQSKKDAK